MKWGGKSSCFCLNGGNGWKYMYSVHCQIPWRTEIKLEAIPMTSKRPALPLPFLLLRCQRIMLRTQTCHADFDRHLPATCICTSDFGYDMLEGLSKIDERRGLYNASFATWTFCCGPSHAGPLHLPAGRLHYRFLYPLFVRSPLLSFPSRSLTWAVICCLLALEGVACSALPHGLDRVEQGKTIITERAWIIAKASA